MQTIEAPTTHHMLPTFDNRTHYKDPCPMCSNRGHYPIGVVCPQCNGAGWVIKPRVQGLPLVIAVCQEHCIELERHAWGRSASWADYSDYEGAL